MMDVPGCGSCCSNNCGHRPTADCGMNDICSGINNIANGVSKGICCGLNVLSNIGCSLVSQPSCQPKACCRPRPHPPTCTCRCECRCERVCEQRCDCERRCDC